MKTKSKIPMRQCTGCREMKSKKEMMRVLRTPEEEIVLDVTGKKNGRGAYLCKSADCLEKAIKSAVGSILEKVTLFDVYKGKQVGEGKKSVAYSISMRSHEATLTDEQADAAMKRVLKELSKLGAELRG